MDVDVLTSREEEEVVTALEDLSATDIVADLAVALDAPHQVALVVLGLALLEAAGMDADVHRADTSRKNGHGSADVPST